MFDIAVFEDLNSYYSGWLEKQGQVFQYLPRYTKDNMPYGLCSRCNDETTYQITDSHCPVCFGTGYTGGYDNPLTGPDAPYQKVYGVLQGNDIFTDWQKTGPVSTEQEQLLYLRLLTQPAISDIVIDEFGARYRVGTHIANWNFYGKQLGYVVTVFQQSRDNIIYSVPISNANPSGAALLAGQRTRIEIAQLYNTVLEVSQAI